MVSPDRERSARNVLGETGLISIEAPIILSGKKKKNDDSKKIIFVLKCIKKYQSTKNDEN